MPERMDLYPVNRPPAHDVAADCPSVATVPAAAVQAGIVAADGNRSDQAVVAAKDHVSTGAKENGVIAAAAAVSTDEHAARDRSDTGGASITAGGAADIAAAVAAPDDCATACGADERAGCDTLVGDITAAGMADPQPDNLTLTTASAAAVGIDAINGLADLIAETADDVASFTGSDQLGSRLGDLGGNDAVDHPDKTLTAGALAHDQAPAGAAFTPAAAKAGGSLRAQRLACEVETLTQEAEALALAVSEALKVYTRTHHPLPRPNYQTILDKTLAAWSGSPRRPSLLLHSCCAPCSSYVLSYLSRSFDITLLYYNPNISPPTEYEHRLAEQHRLIEEMPLPSRIRIIDRTYEPEVFACLASGREREKEGGARCLRCYALRLCEAARLAKKLECDYFTTTLTISPHKNALLINELGRLIAARYQCAYLYSDFKKRGGFQASTRLSRQYGLYRQDFCGCVYSKQEAEQRARARAQAIPPQTDSGGSALPKREADTGTPPLPALEEKEGKS